MKALTRDKKKKGLVYTAFIIMSNTVCRDSTKKKKNTVCRERERTSSQSAGLTWNFPQSLVCTNVPSTYANVSKTFTCVQAAAAKTIAKRTKN